MLGKNLKQLAFVALSTCMMVGIVVCGIIANTASLEASSHREAPAITHAPKVDGTDLFMFQSFSDEDINNNDRTVLIANYHPLQDPFGGPNYFFMQENTLYDIHVDNDGDVSKDKDFNKQDITFRFQFVEFTQANDTFRNLAVDTGGNLTEIPLLAIGANDTIGTDGINDIADAELNIVEKYTVEVRINGKGTQLINDATGDEFFFKPLDNVGDTTIPDYETYANAHITTAILPDGSSADIFVGQRDEPFVVNLGEAFDFVDVQTADLDAINGKNITSFCVECDTAFLTREGAVDVIGAFTTASSRNITWVKAPKNPDNANGNAKNIRLINAIKFNSSFKQASRLGNPLVNELVIGVGFKDTFNASVPANDIQFLDFVTDPSLAVVLNAVGAVGANTTDRQDLVEVFLTGNDGLNQDGSVGEILRLNTTTTPVAAANQDRLAVIGGTDTAGFPNGRRPGDDVVDIALQVVGGELDGNANDLSDLVDTDPTEFLDDFPFLNTPLAGDDATVVPFGSSAALKRTRFKK